jgi:hypothetical protein
LRQHGTVQVQFHPVPQPQIEFEVRHRDTPGPIGTTQKPDLKIELGIARVFHL